MTTIYATDTDTIHEAEFIFNGQDALADMMGNNGVMTNHDHDCDFEMTEEEALWWVRWAEREERVNEASKEATQEQWCELLAAAEIYSSDLEAMQNEEERILGIEDCN